jgi:CheY-like chemotaxis protein
MDPATSDTERAVRTLVVDDNPTNRLVLQAIFEEQGCQVTVACDGVEGCEVASASTFDLIVMDRNMPRRTGDEAAALIRDLNSASSGALIALWTTDPPEAQLPAAYDARLCKPVNFDSVTDLISQARARAASSQGDHRSDRTNAA